MFGFKERFKSRVAERYDSLLLQPPAPAIGARSGLDFDASADEISIKNYRLNASLKPLLQNIAVAPEKPCFPGDMQLPFGSHSF